MLEIHGVGRQGNVKALTRETQDGRIHIKTGSPTGEYLSREEAIYLASRLRRMARRIHNGLPQMTDAT